MAGEETQHLDMRPQSERWVGRRQPIEAFRDLYGQLKHGEWHRVNPDGSENTVEAYELIIDPLEQQRFNRSVILDFGRHATQAGYKQALGPVILTGTGFADKEGERSLTTIYFFLEKPSIAE